MNHGKALSPSPFSFAASFSAEKQNPLKVQRDLHRIKQVVATVRAFAALRCDGRVYTWGDAEAGGDSGMVRGELQRVKQLYATKYAFAAVRDLDISFFKKLFVYDIILY